VSWLWHLLLRLYDADFRERHGREVLAAIEAERNEPRYRGTRGAIRHVCHVTLDLIAGAIRRSRAPAVTSPLRSMKMDALRQDLRYACRQMLRRPGFATVAILSLALGIGGNTAVFGIVDSYVLHPFAFPDPSRLVVIGPVFPKLSRDTRFVEVLSPLEYEDIRTATSLARTAAFDLGNRNISGGDVPDRVFTALMLDDAFAVIGLRPHLGRGFTAEELQPNGPPAAIISHRIWLSRFHGDPSLVGKTIRVNGRAATLVGVMPPELLLIGTDLWVPWGARPEQAPRNMRNFSVIARLADNASLGSTEAELATIASRVAADHVGQFAEYDGWRLVPTPFANALLQSARPAGFLVLGAVSLVLFIACANLASLMLARATGRQREFAVRVALGAGRGRLARQLLTEVAVLAGVGGAAGLGLAAVAIRASNALLPPPLTAFGLTAAVNARIAGWCLLSTTAAILLVALLPVFQTRSANPSESLKQDARSSTASAGARRARHGLIVAEIALAMMLALGAGVLLRSFLNLQHVDTGVNAGATITMRLTLPQEKYKGGEAITAFFEELARRVEALPGIAHAGFGSQFPPQSFFRIRVAVDGTTAPAGTTFPTTQITIASRGYFDALGIARRAGRTFDEQDRPNAPHVVVVNEAFVAKYLDGRPAASAIGARIRLGDRPDRAQPHQIIGVVASTTNVGTASPPAPEIFIPMEQGRDAWNQLFLVASTAGDPMAAVPAIRQAVASLDRDQPVYAIQTLEQAFEANIVTQQVSAVLMTVFATVALVLAGVGIYGVTSYAVRSRTQEIGIRMAMGAERHSVMWMVLQQVLLHVAAGLTIGIGGVVAAGPALSAVLFGVSPVDPLTVAATATVLGLVAVGAAWWPASSASRVDPVVALRAE
jgi:predicted permease